MSASALRDLAAENALPGPGHAVHQQGAEVLGGEEVLHRAEEIEGLVALARHERLLVALPQTLDGDHHLEKHGERHFSTLCRAKRYF